MRTAFKNFTLCIMSSIAGASSLIAVPENWPSDYPAWWFNEADPANGVIDATKPILNQDNNTVLNQGQLLNIADIGIRELNEQLSPLGGANFTLSDLRDANKTPFFLSPVALGQLKLVSSKFHQRFDEIGFGPENTGWPSTLILNEGVGDHSLLYPWKENQTPDNLLTASIGQAKHLFSWDLESWTTEDTENGGVGDGFPDWLEQFYFNNLTTLTDSTADTNGDGLTDLEQLLAGVDPTVFLAPPPNNTTPPRLPGIVVIDSVSDTEARISWAPSGGETRIVGYQVYVNGAVAFFSTVPNARISGLIPSTNTLTSTYDIQVRALNQGGEFSALSPVTQLTTTQTPATRSLQLSAYNHNMLIKEDGSLWAWGNAAHGALGLNSGTDSTARSLIPVENFNLDTEIVSISAGEDFTLAVGAGGELFSWGNGGSGRLGLGNSLDRPLPTQNTIINGIDGARAIAGHNHGMFIGTLGEILTFGSASNEKLGRDITKFPGSSNFPGKVEASAGGVGFELPGAVSGAVNDFASYVVSVSVQNLNSEKKVYAWGDGQYIGRGNSNGNQRYPQPVQVSSNVDLDGVEKVAGGQSHALALKSDGTVWAWGNNRSGEIGSGNISHALFATQVMRDDNLDGIANGPLGDGSAQSPTIIEIDAGEDWSMALDSNGDVWTWGNENSGRLGYEASSNQTLARKITGILDSEFINDIASGFRHGLAIGNSGTVYAWGDSQFSQLGYREVNGALPAPVYDLNVMPELARPTFSVQSGAYLDRFEVYITSSNISATVHYTIDGSEPTAASPIIAPDTPVLIANTSLLRAKAFHPTLPASFENRAHYHLGVVGDTGDHSILGFNTGEAFVWGRGDLGQLGLGGFSDIDEPTLNPSIINAENMVSVDRRSLVVANDGEVMGFGFNGGSSGLLGLGPDFSGFIYDLPQLSTVIPSLVRSVAGGNNHSLALSDTGEVYSWGSNSSGQLGRDVSPGNSSPTPTPVSDESGASIRNFIAVEASADVTYAINTEGYLLSWGEERESRLGYGATTDQEFPAFTNGINNVVSVAGGDSHTVVLRGDGSVWAFGSSSSGELGNNTNTNSIHPVRVLAEDDSGGVTPLGNIVSIGAGDDWSVALDANGDVWTWGESDNIRLGYISALDQLVARRVPTFLERNVQWITAGDTSGLAFLEEHQVLHAWGGYQGASQGGLGNSIDSLESELLRVAVDLDGDGIDQWYEALYSATEPNADLDEDGLTNLEEFTHGTNPTRADTDRDGLPDAYEIATAGQDPTVVDSEDLGTDLNSDGIEDSIGLENRIAITNNNVDGDSLTNAEELALGTSPLIWDTDGDGVEDGLDPLPLDPYVSNVLLDPNDTSAPTILLLTPSQAISL